MPYVPKPEEWNDTESAEWIRWINERPPSVRKTIEEYPPWKMYRVIDGGPATGNIVGYTQDDDGGCTQVTIHIHEGTPIPRNVKVPLSKLREV